MTDFGTAQYGVTNPDQGWWQDVNNLTYRTYPAFTASVNTALTERGVCVTDAPYNADPTGVTDSTAALLAAAAANVTLIFPAGTYKVSQTIHFTSSLFGYNSGTTFITCSNLTVPTATLQGINVQCSGIQFAHTSAPAAGSGADGLQLLPGSFQSIIQSCMFQYNDNGLTVQSGNSALWIEKNYGSHNSSYGFYLVDPRFVFRANSSNANGLGGFYVTALTASQGLQMSDNTSYTNTGYGYYFKGTASAALNNIYMVNNISIQDANHGFYFDTYGRDIYLSNCSARLDGTTTTFGGGYYFTANNAQVSISGCEAVGCVGAGLYNGGSSITITAGSYTYNGLGSTNYGIAGTNAGYTSIMGSQINNNTAGQQSTSPGYASFYNCPGLNLVTVPAAPALPASGTGLLNPFNMPMTVYLTSTTYTGIELKLGTVTTASITAPAGGSYNVAPGATIIPFYTGTPSWVWVPA